MNESLKRSRKSKAEYAGNNEFKDLSRKLKSRRASSKSYDKSKSRNDSGSNYKSRRYQESSSKQNPRYPYYMESEGSIGNNKRNSSYQSQRDRYYSKFMEKYMSAGLINFMKDMIDNRVCLLVRSEVKKQVKNRMDDAELKLMKFVQNCVSSAKKKELMFEMIKPQTERSDREHRFKSKASSMVSN